MSTAAFRLPWPVTNDQLHVKDILSFILDFFSKSFDFFQSPGVTLELDLVRFSASKKKKKHLLLE